MVSGVMRPGFRSRSGRNGSCVAVVSVGCLELCEVAIGQGLVETIEVPVVGPAHRGQPDCFGWPLPRAAWRVCLSRDLPGLCVGDNRDVAGLVLCVMTAPRKRCRPLGL